MNNNINRRLFMRYLAGSPLLAGLAATSIPETLANQDTIPAELDNLIDSPEKAINIFDFETIAREKLPPGSPWVSGNRRGRQPYPASQRRGLYQNLSAP